MLQTNSLKETSPNSMSNT